VLKDTIPKEIEKMVLATDKVIAEQSLVKT
jgi:hypothetical protein